MVRVVPLSDSGGDERGASFPFPLGSLGAQRDAGFGAPFELRDAHVAALRPGAVRGNHFHTRRREILVVLPGARWSLWWDHGEGTPVETASFDGSVPVAVLIAPLASHAVRNDDAHEMQILGLSDIDYDAADADVFGRDVVSSRR
jgi:dTDP-4-dehydrorhamnose 3,5-epimerase-like enzyme